MTSFWSRAARAVSALACSEADLSFVRRRRSVAAEEEEEEEEANVLAALVEEGRRGERVETLPTASYGLEEVAMSIVGAVLCGPAGSDFNSNKKPKFSSS